MQSEESDEMGSTGRQGSRHAAGAGRLSRRRLRFGRTLAACITAAGFVIGPLAPAAHAILASDGGPFATRLTSTQGLTSGEAALYALLGQFRGFLGTPIDATHFITAKHIGIAPTDTISFSQGPNVGSYSILGWVDDPGSDLRIVEIAGTFQSWVPLSGSSYEANKTATIFGRGGAPLESVIVGSELKGWTADAPDGQISWGRNVIAGTLLANNIYARFEINGLPQEAGLTIGDSGGPWFAPDGQGLMRLIGVSFAVTGPYQLDVAGAPSGIPFQAALVDLGGLWVGDVGDEVFITDNPVNVVSVAIASRISNRISWISNYIDLTTEDTDRDGVLNQFDNCPWISNANQADNGGLGSSTTPDGIGNVCQCGDVTGEGQVNDTDAAFIKRHALGLSAPLFIVPNNCDVTGEGTCNGTDATLIRHAAIGNVSPRFGQNCRNAIP